MIQAGDCSVGAEEEQASRGGGEGKGRLLENVAEISHNPPGWGERGPRVWEHKGAGASGPYANDRAVEAGAWKAVGREGKFRDQVLVIPDGSLVAKSCGGVDSKVMGAEKTEELRGWRTDQ